MDIDDDRSSSQQQKKGRAGTGAAAGTGGGGGGGGGGYVWEEEYKRSWDIIKEDESGSLLGVVKNLQRELRRRRLQKDTASIQRGIIRHLFVIIDLSKAMLDVDMRPSNIESSILYLTSFIEEFFDQNPISQMGIIVTREGLAEKLTELSGNPSEHIRALQRPETKECRGEPSFQNALLMAQNTLSHLPHHGSREILLINASLTTCDPDDIFTTVQQIQDDSIRVSVISLSAEMQLLKNLAKVTGGSFGVPLNEQFLKDLLWDNIPPPPIFKSKHGGGGAGDENTNELLVMGFPAKLKEFSGDKSGGSGVMEVSLCACHNKPTRSGFLCPQCNSKICELPTECVICGLTLVSSPHLARSYHHLFPVSLFKEVTIQSQTPSKFCYSCQTPFEGTSSSTGKYACPNCRNDFCLECDIYVHETLHNCPGCWV